MRRPRGPGGRFLTAAEIAELDKFKESMDSDYGAAKSLSQVASSHSLHSGDQLSSQLSGDDPSRLSSEGAPTPDA